MNALEIRGLKKYYGVFSLDIGELTLERGTILGLVGENGAGKSTTIRLILGLIQKEGGTVSVLGGALTPAVKERVGAVLDVPGIPGLTAAQLSRVMKNVYAGWDMDRFADLLYRLNIPVDKHFDELSQGMKQKLQIAAAMSHGAELLVLDEPTNGLDPVAREEKNAVLISSHIVSDLEKICDRVAFLHEGKILLCEEKDALAASYGLLRCPKERLDELDGGAILTRRDTPYYSEAVVRRSEVPESAELYPVGIEEIFVAMVKGDAS